MADSHRKQLAALTDEIVACRMCTRLVDWREKIGKEKRASYKDWDYWAKESKYWIGNIEGKINGWCLREHIYGILVQVDVLDQESKQYFARPHPKKVYQEVSALVKDDRWSEAARKICEPQGLRVCEPR